MKRKVICLSIVVAMIWGTIPAYASIADENLVWSANFNTETGEMTVLTDTTAAPANAAPLPNHAVRIVVDAQELTARGVVIDGRTLVPLRALGEALGATIKWDASKQEIQIEKMLNQTDSKGVITKNNMLLQMYVNEHRIFKNGEEEMLDVAPQIIDGSTMVPVKVATDFFGAKASWDNDSYAVRITS